MNISLTPQLETFVKQKVETGMYNSASEVMREALRLLEERDALQNARLEALKEDITQGIASVEKGDVKPFNLDDIKAKGRAKLGGEPT